MIDPAIPKETLAESPSFMEQEIGVDLLVHDCRVLLKCVVLPEKTKSGLLLPETMRNMERRAYHVGLILGMGNQAFDPERFGGKEASYCKIKVGDWVYYSSYEREQIQIGDHLCYMINDDRVYATIQPSQLSKIIPELER